MALFRGGRSGTCFTLLCASGQFFLRALRVECFFFFPPVAIFFPLERDLIDAVVGFFMRFFFGMTSISFLPLFPVFLIHLFLLVRTIGLSSHAVFVPLGSEIDFSVVLGGMFLPHIFLPGSGLGFSKIFASSCCVHWVTTFERAF